MRRIAAIALLASVACGGDTTTPRTPTHVVVTPSVFTLIAGQTLAVSAEARDDQGAIAYQEFAWASSDTTVATVAPAASGTTVTAKRAGTATIMATVGGIMGAAALTVVPPPVATVSITPAEPTVVVRQTIQLTANSYDAHSTLLSGRSATWSTADTAIATVSAAGIVTGKAVGQTVISAMVEGQRGSVTITVLPPPVYSIVISSAGEVMTIGQSTALGIRLYDATGEELTGRSITWSSGNPSVATVVAGQTGSPADLVTVSAHALGQATILAVSEGVATSVQVVVAPSTFSALASPATARTCAIRTGGWLYCWGENASGAVGDGTVTTRLTPTRVAIPVDGVFASATTGWDVTCGLRTTGEGYCWGAGNRLGDGTTTPRRLPTLPIALPSGVRVQALSTGSTFSCAIGTDTKSYCWGDGPTGDGTGYPQRLSPVEVATPAGVTFEHVAAGVMNACAITPGGVAYCWGESRFGAIGNDTVITATDTRVTSPVPVKMPGADLFSDISVGGYFVCARARVGTVYCWGQGRGVLGDGSSPYAAIEPRYTHPVAIVMPAGVTFSTVSAGEFFACALDNAGRAWCWGNNPNGQLGDGTTTAQSVPTMVQMPPGVSFQQLMTGSAHACALSTDGRVFCWGDNSNGQLGDGTTTMRAVPAPVNFP